MRRQTSHIFWILVSIGVLVMPLSVSHADSRELTIVAFGDSTTATRMLVDQVYSQRLQDLLTGKGIQALVINAGVGGSHTGRLSDNSQHKRRHALDRFNDAVRARNPDLVIIQYGINDAWIDQGGPMGYSRIPLEDYRKNLAHMIETLKEDGASVILMTPNPIGRRFERWRYYRVKFYAEAAREVASSCGVELLDVWNLYEGYAAELGRNVDDLMLDGTHPNDEGHRLVAEGLAGKINSGYSSVRLR